ncbi:MAG: NAD(P)/FAD-dependent oxidoreductase [Phycisphaera sp.]|nr:NAD(P)/FAD-dependent oxidoreductase [Phycisphaera sp.]
MAMADKEAGCEYDVAIIGGGPAGSTLASIILTYRPDTRIIVLEKETFPRDHVGESQLPAIGAILDEMGCWDKVERAGFPLKVGATYRWGRSPELWNFDFIDPKVVEEVERPSPYGGPRKQTAFQVDRAIYDEILLDHAAELGTEVRQSTVVREIKRDGDRIESLELGDGTSIHARWYVDASGHTGVLRRAMGVETTPQTNLQNIAFWDYWENAEWAVEIGVGATRVQVLSQPAGWVWFIPIGPTRTSIGCILPAEHYKDLGKTPEEIYHETIAADPRVTSLTRNATSRGMVEATKDWSFTADRGHGENWFLVGESLGFADPILAAGMSLAHTGARELGYTMIELLDGARSSEEEWLKESISEQQLRRVKQHIKFADFWYAANGQFTDLQEHCRLIAAESGMKMKPDAAWRWLAQGGFTTDSGVHATAGSFDPGTLKQVQWMLTDRVSGWKVNKYNVYKLNLHNAERRTMATYSGGKVQRRECLVRGHNVLPLAGWYGVLVDLIKIDGRIDRIFQSIARNYGGQSGVASPQQQCMQALEVLLTDSWVSGRLDKKLPRLTVQSSDQETLYVHWNRDECPGKTAPDPA